ncbi:DUF1146 family protein [Chengkuizengella axinellae]|uniref:DUF1146 family protein n=1 Tax=Chengkuizengella axinellae TaxID=3064388 RepID=A0ABT9J5W6_9BACL|nr:DUF1146 family protein [Chengkuizengella sp. 2205SS18-9]MDP5276842.1 DUF1146 family protein [Chengkuizengella sp. 2205SS18-9]
MIMDTAVQNITNIFIVLFSILLCWRVLQSFRFDVFMKNPNSIEAKLLKVIITIVIGYQLGSFIIDYYDWSQAIRYIIG